jgi:tetratricopeptide (TPR) repeat protein
VTSIASLRALTLGLGVLFASLLSAAEPAQAQWLRAESEHFVVYSDRGEQRLREQAAELEDFHQLLRQLTGTRDEGHAPKLPIYIVRGIGQLRQVWPGASAGIAGFYNATPQGILAVVDADAGRGWVGRNEILFHEYAHHFMLQHFPAVYPRWYVEGFAEYVATARLEPDTIEYGRMNSALASWVGDSSRLIPLDQILFVRPERIERGATQYYAQSWLLVHYLLRDAERMRQLNRYLTAVGAGQEPRAAFQAAFAMTPSDMQRRLASYGSGGMSFTRIRRASASRAPTLTVTPLPRGVGDLLLLDAAMTAGAGSDGDAFARRVRRAAGDSPEPFARRILARAEALHGDGAVAERLLTEMIAASPRDAEPHYLMGMRHLRAGRAEAAERARHFRTAQTWFARAHRLDENHYPTLYHYAEAVSADQAALLSDNTTNILLLAQQLAPQADTIRLSTANLLIRRERWAEAEALLAPMVSQPHGGSAPRRAEALLAKARARDKTGLPPVFGAAGENQSD